LSYVATLASANGSTNFSDLTLVASAPPRVQWSGLLPSKDKPCAEYKYVTGGLRLPACSGELIAFVLAIKDTAKFASYLLADWPKRLLHLCDLRIHFQYKNGPRQRLSG
jgi:hypothetical protein